VTRGRLLIAGDLSSPHVMRWAQPLSDLGWRVAVVGFGEDVHEAVECFRLGSAAGGDARFGRAVPRYVRVVRGFRPDVVHAHFASSYGVLAALASRHVPLVISAWGSDILSSHDRPRWVSPLITYALRRARFVTGDSTDVLAAVARRAPRTQTERVVFGPELGWTTAPRAELALILSARQPRDFYRIPTIVEAFGKAQERLPDWTLDVIAWGEPPAELQQARARIPQPDQVRFLPFLDRRALEAEHLAAAVFVSIPDHDGTSVSVLEGMAAGAFPILSDIPANRELVRDGENGILVPTGDTALLAAALERACLDEDLRSRARAANRIRIARSATSEAAVASLDQIYCKAQRSHS
jgi:glycosyltransferase involved in cell wall biosynthesis